MGKLIDIIRTKGSKKPSTKEVLDSWLAKRPAKTQKKTVKKEDEK